MIEHPAPAILVTHTVLEAFCAAALQSRQVRPDVAQHVITSLIQTSLRGVDSHGIELLPHYLRALDAGRINPHPTYQLTASAPSTAVLYADHTFGHAAGAEAMLQAVELARTTGVGVVTVSHSTHFGAAAYFGLLAADRGMIGICMTHSTPHMLSFAGVRPFFSTNPICFAAPCEEEPYCLDMATSLSTWNRLLAYKQAGEQIPPDWGADAQGQPTTSPDLVASMLPIGGYKGFGLSMIVDVLCSLLTGMPFGRDISAMYAEPLSSKRMLGHFFLAIDVERFVGLAVFRQRMQAMMDAVRNEPPADPATPVLVAGDPEKETARRRLSEGIPVSPSRYTEFLEIARALGFTAFA